VKEEMKFKRSLLEMYVGLEIFKFILDYGDEMIKNMMEDDNNENL